MFSGEGGGEAVEEDDCGLDDAVFLEVHEQIGSLRLE
jgi:hypothetical protein